MLSIIYPTSSLVFATLRKELLHFVQSVPESLTQIFMHSAANWQLLDWPIATD